MTAFFTISFTREQVFYVNSFIKKSPYLIRIFILLAALLALLLAGC